MNCKLLFLLLVIFFYFYSNCKEGMDNFHIDEFKYIDNEVEEKQYNYHSKLLNIYGEPLKECRSYGSDDKDGSWNDGYCSEMGGGVHQICLDVDKTDDFSLNTGQTDWSEGRKGKNHCMCLGAWALYKARQAKGEIPKTDNELHCESITEHALKETYVDKWNKWNGYELDNQIVQGVNELMNQCYHKGNPKQKKYLKSLYDELKRGKPEFNIR
jgi:hypothetical protein